MSLIMRKKIFTITFFSIILLTNIGLTSVFAEQMIEQIRLDASTVNQDKLIIKLNGPYLPKAFALKGDNPRVVFDFPDVVPAKKIQNIIQADGTFVKQIRTGIHGGDNPKTRIVLDIEPGSQVDFSQDFDKETNTLVITLSPAGTPPETAAAAEEKPEKAAAEAVREEAQPAEPPEEVTAEKPAITETIQPEAVQKEAEKEAAPVVPAPATKMEPTAAIQPPQETMAEEAVKTEKAPTAGPKGLPKPELEESTVIQPLSEIGEKEKPAPKTGSAPTLYSVDFDNTSYRGEIVSFKLNAFNPPVVFGIEEDIPRIVCFFKDTTPGKDLVESIESNGKFIKNIKVGKYRNPDNVRVVLDLVPGKNYDLQQIFFKEDNLFMVIINTTGEKVAN